MKNNIEVKSVVEAVAEYVSTEYYEVGCGRMLVDVCELFEEIKPRIKGEEWTLDKFRDMVKNRLMSCGFDTEKCVGEGELSIMQSCDFAELTPHFEDIAPEEEDE